MKKWFRQGLLVLLSAALLASVLPVGYAAETGDERMAQAIDVKEAISDFTGFGSCDMLYDGNLQKPLHIWIPTSLTFTHPEGVGSAYLIFDKAFGSYTLVNNETGQSHTCGKGGFLHEFIDIEGVFGNAPKSVSVYFEGELWLNEVQLFTSGQVPSYVEKWEVPKDGKVDMMLFSTHGDDEQLFFAGLLPYYGAELGYEVLVVYLTNHFNTEAFRPHEMLNGLWAVGITTYPVIGPFGDYYCKNAQGGYELHAYMKEPVEDMQAYVVENLRRFKPQVAIGHDIKGGEYGHGQHMMYADLLINALDTAEDESKFPESAKKWGTWSVPKTYLHLWPENPVVIDWDQPLEHFNGMTAYQVTKQLGFPAHKSQITSFTWYMDGKDTAASIKEYSPCEYGLYRSTIGPDVKKNDLFENLTSYAQQEAEAAAAEAAAEAAIAQPLPPPETQAPTQPLPPEEPEAAHGSLYLTLTAAVLVLTLLAALAAALKRQPPKEES